jgi:thiol-disulfide isomerase/thioredoxin
MIRFAFASALLMLVIAASSLAQGPAPAPAEAPAPSTAGQAVPDPEDSPALGAYFKEQFRALSTMVGADVDQAASALAALKDRVQPLAPASAESRTLVRRGQAAIRYFEGEIDRARAGRAGLEGPLDANPDDLDALSKYTLQTTREAYSRIVSNPAAVRKRLARARGFLTGLRSRASEEARAKIVESLSRLDRIEMRIEAAKNRKEVVGQKAPPLGVETWINGTPLRDEDLRGKVVLIEFWAVWCGPCIATLPDIRHWNETYAEKGLVVLGLTGYFNLTWDEKSGNYTHSRAEVPHEQEQAMLLQFAAKHKLTYRFGISSDFPFGTPFGVTGIPQVVIIDREGIIRFNDYSDNGPNSREITELLQKLLEPGGSAGG